jgi:hypothetical protein
MRGMWRGDSGRMGTHRAMRSDDHRAHQGTMADSQRVHRGRLLFEGMGLQESKAAEGGG